MTGRVKFFNMEMGFGFITPDPSDGQGDLFVHWTAVEGQPCLAEGQVVEFERSFAGRPDEARNVRVVAAGDPSAPRPGSGSAMTGRVKFLREDRGYGFITPTDGSEDVIVHLPYVEQSGYTAPSQGQLVEFEVAPGCWNREALNVRVMSLGAPAPASSLPAGICLE